MEIWYEGGPIYSIQVVGYTETNIGICNSSSNFLNFRGATCTLSVDISH